MSADSASLSPLLVDFFFFNFHLFSLSLVSLLSCHFAVGGQWLGARCVLGQLPLALHTGHANCRCGLLVPAKWGVFKPTPLEQTLRLKQKFFVEKRLGKGSVRANVTFFYSAKRTSCANPELCKCLRFKIQIQLFLIQPHLNKVFPIFSTFTWNVLMLFLNSVKTECLSAQQAGFAPILSGVERGRQERWQNLLLWLSAQETRAKNTGGVKHRDKVKNTRCIAELMVCQWHLHTCTHTLTTGPKITPRGAFFSYINKTFYSWCSLFSYNRGLFWSLDF